MITIYCLNNELKCSSAQGLCVALRHPFNAMLRGSFFFFSPTLPQSSLPASAKVQGYPYLREYSLQGSFLSMFSSLYFLLVSLGFFIILKCVGALQSPLWTSYSMAFHFKIFVISLFVPICYISQIAMMSDSCY